MSLRFAAALAFSSVLAGAALAQAPERLRGTITSVEGDTLHVAGKGGAETSVNLSPDAKVTAVVPTTLADVKPGSFIGTAARTEPDGTLRALEVHVFPETMRGAGEGHRPFDLGPKSTMTNGTVGQEVVGNGGNTLTVRYKGGEKVITVPPDVPVVTFEPGTRPMLMAGAHVILFGLAGEGSSLTTRQVVVGKDGLVPPM